MLNKLEFNNLVITNKKIIQQARSQTIAKLVQKLRKLKEALQKQPENVKHKERLRRNVECMAQLKALKRAELMRSLLLLDNRHNAVLTNGRATPDEKAIAMLALNKKMQQLVAKFRENLKLSADPDAKWRTDILETSKRRIKLDRTEEKRRRRKELKEQKALNRNRLEWLNEHKPSADVITSEVLETPQPEINDEKPTGSKPDKLEKQQTVQDKSKKPKTDTKHGGINQKPNVGVQQQQMDINQKPQQKQREINQKPKVQREFNEKTKKARPDRWGGSTQRESNDKPQEDNPQQGLNNNKSKRPKQEDKQRPTYVVDPFFITESGQPYLSTAVVLSGDSHNESDADDDNHMAQRTRKPPIKRQEYNERRPHNDRHPSWLAKEQQKPIITSFKGTKTKFSDDGNAAETTIAAPSAGKEESAAGMHPSWIAKQRLKPKIAAFAGTKIKFDDD
ncbi:translation initiation factor IF-2 [Drosophila grimshawi]|uniref:GH18201 n=1 Tax=Drosophila grimshawi TaxID=7222 RepID=B4JFU7_DROGR|nr:translation initiation factor IF-2 [Drosophila grimshawi]EDV93578.1 GH18201 [Drosophila grimshawi]